VISLLTVLTPIVPGDEPDLERTLAGLSRGPSPLARLDYVHFARWVVIGEVRGRFPKLSRNRRQLRMRYLLFTAGFDGSVEHFVEDVRTTLGDTADRIWGSCIGYPGASDRDEVHRYFEHNRLAIPHSFLAYEHSVPQVKAALGLREKYIRLAMAAQTADDAELLSRFKAEFG